MILGAACAKDEAQSEMTKIEKAVKGYVAQTPTDGLVITEDHVFKTVDEGDYWQVSVRHKRHHHTYGVEKGSLEVSVRLTIEFD